MHAPCMSTNSDGKHPLPRFVFSAEFASVPRFLRRRRVELWVAVKVFQLAMAVQKKQDNELVDHAI